LKAPPLSRKRKENNGPALSYGPWASMRRARKARPNKRSSRLRRTTSLETNQLTAELLAWRSTTNSGLIYLAVSLPRLQRGEKKISGDSDEALSPASGGRGHGHQLPPGGHHPQGNLPASSVLPLGSTDLPLIFSIQSSPSSLTHGRLGFSHAHTSLQTTPNHRGNRPGSPQLSCKNRSHNTQQVLVKNVSVTCC